MKKFFGFARGVSHFCNGESSMKRALALVCRKGFSVFVLVAMLAVVALVSDARAILIVTNGDFEAGFGTGQVQDVPSWFDATGDFVTWVQDADQGIKSDAGTGYTASRHLGSDGPGSWIYQSLGAKSAGESSISWSFFQGRFLNEVAGTGFDVRFYEGAFTGADGTDITGFLTQIGSTASFAFLGAGVDGRINSGSLDISGVANGTEIWLRIGGTGGTDNPFGPIDNILVTVPEPASGLLLLVGAAVLLGAKRRFRAG